MAASRIFAEPGTLTGSIGVFGGKINLGGTYGKLGIHSEVITRGANANLFSSTSGFSDSERESMTKLIEDVYDQFLTKAIEGRNKAGNKMDRAKLESLAGGRVWTGRQAKENGLVDELGTLSDAIRFAAKNSGLPADKEPELLMLPKSRGFLDSLFEPKAQVGTSQIADFLKAIPFARELRGAGTLLQIKSEPVWLLMPYRLTVQ
jgi:protease-4